MKTKTINQVIKINASVQKVWQVLWEHESYKKWAAAYTKGSYYTGDLQQGGRIQFLAPNNNGMESEVYSLTENREVTFHHLHEIEGGKEGQNLGGLVEKYELEEQQGATILSVTSEMPEEYFTDLDAGTAKALQIVKELAEA